MCMSTHQRKLLLLEVLRKIITWIEHFQRQRIRFQSNEINASAFLALRDF